MNNNNLHLINITSKEEKVGLETYSPEKSKKEIEKEKEHDYSKIESNLNPFISKVDLLKEKTEYIYVYLEFKEIISSEDVQKCIQKLSNSNHPNYKTVSEVETSVILKIKRENFNSKILKKNDRYLSYFSKLASEPKILESESYSEAFKEIDKNFQDDYSIKDVIIVFKDLQNTEEKNKLLSKKIAFTELKLIPDLGIVFGVLKNPKDINIIREFDFVECAYLEDLVNIEEYGFSKDKTKIPVTIISNEKNLNNKPSVCIIDCGVSKIFKVLSEEKLGYLSDELLDHGTQVASITTSAEDLIKGKNKLIQQYNIFSYKISDGKKENIIEGLVNAINKFSDKTKLFVLSYNFYYKLNSNLLNFLTKRLDYFIHKKDAIVLVSTGNNAEETIRDSLKYNYLDKNPILFPSNCKNIFSVGALKVYNDPFKSIADYTRSQIYFPTLDQKGEEYYILKPNLYVFGGSENNPLYSVSADSFLVKSYGTSFANALAGFYFLLLIEKYHNIKFSETFKAIMLSCGDLDFLRNRDEACSKISVKSITDLKSESKFILLYDEHSEELNKYKPSRNRFTNKLEQKAEELKFYVDAKKIEKIQIFLVHSNNFIKNPFTESIIYFNIRIHAPDKKRPNKKYSSFGDRSKWSTFGKYTPIQAAEYELGKQPQKIKAQTGDWILQVIPRRKNVPLKYDVKIRWGIVIKLIPRKEFENEIEEIYEEILEKTKEIKKSELKLIKEPLDIAQEA